MAEAELCMGFVQSLLANKYVWRSPGFSLQHHQSLEPSSASLGTHVLGFVVALHQQLHQAAPHGKCSAPHHIQAAFPAGNGTSYCHSQLLSSAKAEIPMVVLCKERNNCLKEGDKELSLSWNSLDCDLSKLQGHLAPGPCYRAVL